MNQSRFLSRGSLFFINERGKKGRGEFGGCSSDIHRLITVPTGPELGSASVGKSPREDANSTTDKLARRTDDTCKIGRQEDAPFRFEFGVRQMRFAQLVVELNFTRRQGE